MFYATLNYLVFFNNAEDVVVRREWVIMLGTRRVGILYHEVLGHHMMVWVISYDRPLVGDELNDTARYVACCQ
jgi:hypothetical protein